MSGLSLQKYEFSSPRVGSTVVRRGRGPQRVVLLAGLCGLFLIVGCGKKEPPVFKVYKVHGQVKFNQLPAVGATVVLNPNEGTFPPGVTPMGMTDKDGKFEIVSYKPGDGAAPGKYDITVTWFKVIDAPSGPVPGPNIIPPKYATPENSPLKFTVEAKDLNEIPVIEITPTS